MFTSSTIPFHSSHLLNCFIVFCHPYLYELSFVSVFFTHTSICFILLLHCSWLSAEGVHRLFDLKSFPLFHSCAWVQDACGLACSTLDCSSSSTLSSFREIHKQMCMRATESSLIFQCTHQLWAASNR